MVDATFIKAMKSAQHISLLNFALAIKNMPSVNIMFSEGLTPLIEAIRHKRPDIVSFLLDNGADPNFVDAAGIPPLIYMASYGCDINVAELLLKFGGDPNKGASKTASSLLLAVVFKQLDMIELLLEHGADMHLKGPTGVSPWEQANAQDDDKIVSLMEKYTM